MATYSVWVAQYIRDNDSTRPCHWEIVIKLSVDDSGTQAAGVAFHPDGPTHGFTFKRKMYEAPPSWAGSLPVGTIRADRVSHIAALLAQVEIWTTEAWNCQHWVQLGLMKLHLHGYEIDRDVAQSLLVLQQKMQELLDRLNETRRCSEEAKMLPCMAQ